MFLKELSLIEQVHQKNVCFVIIGMLVINIPWLSHVCIKYHDVLMSSYELKNIAILNVKGFNYRCIPWGLSENKAVNVLNNSVLEDNGVL